MPRDGSLVLSDVRAPTLTIVCEPCARRGTYNVARLKEQHGDAKLRDGEEDAMNVIPNRRGLLLGAVTAGAAASVAAMPSIA
jgi:hypothetical protein